MAWRVVLPGAVWSQPIDQPQETADDERSSVFHDDGHMVEDEGSTSIQLPRLNVRGFLDVGFNISSVADGQDDSFTMGQFNLSVVDFEAYRLELLGELFNIYHDDHTSDQVFDSVGWYAQVSYVVESVTPYYRFDLLNFGGADPYYSPNVNDVHKHTLGARWDLLPWNALKVEYGLANCQDVDDEHLLSVNLSLAF
jgi:hypothetical protein